MFPSYPKPWDDLDLDILPDPIGYLIQQHDTLLILKNTNPKKSSVPP
jgi:hypothetical protein